MSSALSAPHDERSPEMVQSPPASLFGVFSHLGPGLIIAASIVGSGELIGTTKVGADAGFTLLWLILIGCVIKVFTQVEFGRFAVSQGVTTMAAMNQVPGPRLGVNWLTWYWLLMFACSTGQLGGIVGGVGQSLAMTFPITGDFLTAIEAGKQIYTYDDLYWSCGVTAVTIVLLINGRYGLIQRVATVLVAAFTAVTIFNLFALPPQFRCTWDELWHGLTFSFPPGTGQGPSPVSTALKTFGIIGVGASELITYPYWCLERGYARFTGPRDATTAWADRARGWLRVLQYDAWCSMVIYTFATVAFYLLGAAVLHRQGLSPEGNSMIYTLSQMYADVFGSWAQLVFLIGAFAVLYSTFFIATAGNARIAADALRVFGVTPPDEATRVRWVRMFSAIFPCISLGIFVVSKNPVQLVLLSGLAQAVMLPMLGFAAIFFRYRRCDPRLRPSVLWDLGLWISLVGLFVAGSWAAYSFGIELWHKFVPAVPVTG